MGTLMTIHGEVRWLVAILAVVVIIKFAIGWLGRRNYTSLDRSLLTAYTILLDINVLLGLILLFFNGGINGPRLEHAVTMLLAVIAGHMTAMWRRSTDSPTKFRNQLLLVALSLLLVFFGVIRLRGGFTY
jgi:uncharacterized membrane protein